MRVSIGQEECQGLAGSSTGFLFPLLLGSGLEVPILCIQSQIALSHPSTSDPPTLLSGHRDQLKFIFLPAPEQNLGSK